jgi:NAD(P)-dependent dehydrogenase (short-subunit alcohol dehydrogenase family)
LTIGRADHLESHSPVLRAGAALHVAPRCPRRNDAENVLHSNLLSAFLVMKHFAPLIPSAGGSFVCVGSRLGVVGKPGEVLYSAAKGGLIMLPKGAAIEWAPRNIRVDDVAAGLTATPIIEASIQRSPTPRPTGASATASSRTTASPPPEEVADAVTSSSLRRSRRTSPERSYPSTAGTAPSECRGPVL